MSRTPIMDPDLLACFPRVSGDEPPGGYLLAFSAPFSPRERG